MFHALPNKPVQLTLPQTMREELEQLERDWRKPDVSALPKHLDPEEITVMPELYQARGSQGEQGGVTDPLHSLKLSKTLERTELDPIVVLRVGSKNIVIDGHHRLEAYRRANRSVPVTYFEGSPSEALVEAGRENAKDRLPMLPAEKSQRAWSLVREEVKLSKAQIMVAASVSDGSVANMRRVLKEFLEAGKEPPLEWREALRGVNPPPRTFDEDWVEKQAAEWAERLRKALPVIDSTGKVAVLARALIAFSPGRAEDVARALVQELGVEDIHAEDFEDSAPDF